MLTPREAYLGAQEVVPAESACGRIAAESLATYPPGIPNVLPGERLTARPSPTSVRRSSWGERARGKRPPTVNGAGGARVSEPRSAPRYTGIRTFAGAPQLPLLEHVSAGGSDGGEPAPRAVVVGIPFDTTTSWRPGAPSPRSDPLVGAAAPWHPGHAVQVLGRPDAQVVGVQRETSR